MQGDGNLVLYITSTATALWVSGTSGNSGAYAAFQTDGNLVVYSSGGSALWASHTYTYSGLTLSMQDDGNLVIYSGSSALWATNTASNEIDCWPSNGCYKSEFNIAYLGIPPEAPLYGVNGPFRDTNAFAMSVWDQAEGSSIQSNPLDTTQIEPGSYTLGGNTAGVQVYVNANGESADYWGIDAADTTFYGAIGDYGPILTVLRNPLNDPYQQCVNLATAVGNSGWGTKNFSNLC